MDAFGLVDTCTDESFKPSQAALLSGILEALDVLTCDNFSQIFGELPENVRMLILKGLQMTWKCLRDKCHLLLQDDHIFVISKMIVWFTLGQEINGCSADDGCEKVVEFFFGGIEADCKHFLDAHWEHSPFLMTESVMGSKVRSGLLSTWRGKGDSFVLRELLTRMLACPPFSSDALDAVQIYKEIEKNLGKPLIFGQDIRLVKYVGAAPSTENCSVHAAEELDYHNVSFGANTASIGKDAYMYADVQTCIVAYEAGYTIALRGLEFRCPQIAAIAEALAIFFGQATVGANLYLTPSNSQGFKPHYDDHCVFVWQLMGGKFWTLWPPKGLLPRLYSQEAKQVNFCTVEERTWRVLLKEGNLLYLPRGFPHAATTKTQAQMQVTEMDAKSCLQCTQIFANKIFSPVSMAHTETGCCSNREKLALGSTTVQDFSCSSCMKKWEDSQMTIQDSGPSLHITFGVEVEPPFEWEGFMQIALHCWAEDKNWEDILGRKESGIACQMDSISQSDLYKGLLHVAIRQCGDKCSAFRKACLVAAQPFCTEIHNVNSFQSFFKMLLQNVAQTASFRETLEVVLTAIDTPTSTSLDWMHWLRHLSCQHQAGVWIDPVIFFHDRLTSSTSLDGLKDMEFKFTKAKESFVSCASFSRAFDVFILLLHEYRKARKRFTSGMLALQT